MLAEFPDHLQGMHGDMALRVPLQFQPLFLTFSNNGKSISTALNSLHCSVIIEVRRQGHSAGHCDMNG